ncbi:MAG TPA: pyruvate, phosphate dikinase [Firmicutes bacterium]|jgi:pyruvate,orthophosphate dikinase|nr:pyruvate, phosphate dikinase [Bacillota bacterium]
MSTKWVYFFGNGQTDGQQGNKNLVGGKGANLAEMVSLDIPVPAGFTITTEACTSFYSSGERWPEGLEEQVRENLARIEEAMGAKFGDTSNPLLLSVRSGARVSMPGMMDTVLNLGLNDVTVEGLAAKTGNPRFAWDSYRRFIQMYGDVVMGVEHDLFEEALQAVKDEQGVKLDNELSAEALKDLVSRYKEIVSKAAGRLFPDDPFEQLRGSIDAVFKSWNNDRAIRYRKINDIPGDWGTAVNVQAMVFGNMGENSGTGVAFTRDPSTGENVFYGEYLMNAQGEDVVAGIRTPHPISDLKEEMPEVYGELEAIYKKLEQHYRDMQDIEFTIQEGKLYMLQTRSGKRTATAAVRIAVEMVHEGLIDKETAVMRVDPAQIDQLLHPMIDPKAKYDVLAKGLPASPGAAVGRLVFTAHEAEEWANRGEKVILARTETSPEDIGGMDVAEGILTARGGMTSHAAVVARGMGKCCVAGVGAAKIDEVKKTLTVGDTVLKEGDWVTLNGTKGEVIVGQLELVDVEVTGYFGELMEWADEFRKLGVRTNADTPHDAQVARGFGAEGIGLCRTEHMFFEGDRIKAVRQMILAKDKAGREKALAKLLPYQKGDFKGIFKAMQGLPVTVRLLDPPLHEFLPHEDAAIKELAEEMGVTYDELKQTISGLAELNPMLGHRGCRLGVTYPEIYAMQARAIFEAAAELTKEGLEVIPEVMIPLVGTERELKRMKDVCVKVAEEVMAEQGVEFKYLVGTMIEIPRACVVADQIAQEAEFFSFGTNDLTQMTFGFSRDDAGKFLQDYLDQEILAKDPFQTLDQVGVGAMVEMGVERGRSARPDLKIGICGEHGGDPASIDFCHRVGLNYVSCSPFRVPVARLAAAQANIRNPR